MSGISLEQAQAQLAAWLAASLATAQNQEYTIGTRKLRRTDAAEIRQQVMYWQGQVNQLTAAASGRRRGLSISYGVPR